jgi:hypothetical protein
LHFAFYILHCRVPHAFARQPKGTNAKGKVKNAKRKIADRPPADGYGGDQASGVSL